VSEGLRVGRSVTIPEDEIELKFTPSGGPGGQHANRSATRVELTWNVVSSRALDERQRDRIRARLRHRIDSAGVLRLTSDKHRSQFRNRADVRRRLVSLVADALRPQTRRVPTTPTAASGRRRLQSKRRRSETKRLRRSPPPDA
jgi:ribosome-associated protein